jgi:hypothetical protein
VHPTRTAHALIANAFIDAMNARFGTTLAHTDVARIAATDFFVGNRFQPAGEPPFGLFGKDDDPVDEALSTIEDRIDRVHRQVRAPVRGPVLRRSRTMRRPPSPSSSRSRPSPAARRADAHGVGLAGVVRAPADAGVPGLDAHRTRPRRTRSSRRAA